MRRLAAVILAAALACAQLPVLARADAGPAAPIRQALTQWMEDFNAGDAEAACALFAPDLKANVRGVGERGFEAQCQLLKQALADKSKTYRYAVDIKEILVFGDAAIVRLVWTLTIKGKDGNETKSVEPGLDVFHKQPDGSWKIIRYMAYEE
jgi:steroid delta-isomerase